MPLSSDSKKYLAVAAAVAVPIAAIAFVMSTRRSRGGATVSGKRVKSGGVEYPEDMADWTTSHVVAWLKTLGVSDASLERIEDSAVDGAVLPRLREDHLAEMGITKVGDRIKIVAAVNQVKAIAEGNYPATDSPATAPRAAAATTAGAADEPEKEEPDAATADAIHRLQELYAVIGSKDFMTEPPASQLKLLQMADASLEKLLRDLSQFPATNPHKAELVSAATRLRDLVRSTQTGLKGQVSASTAAPQPASAPASAGAGAAAAADDAVDWNNVTQHIVTSLKDILSVVQSDEAARASPEQRQQVLLSATSQVEKIAEFVKKIPDEQIRTQLTQICDITLKEATARLGPGAAAPTATGTAAQPKRTGAARFNPEGYIKELRVIFTELKEKDIIEAPPTEQEAFFAQALARVATICENCDKEPGNDQEKGVVLEMAGNITQALTQTQQLCRSRNEQMGLQSDLPKIEFGKMASHFTEMIALIKSPELASSPKEQRTAVFRKLNTQLNAFRPSMDALSAEERTQLLPVYEKLRQFVTMNLGEPVPAAAAAPTPAEAHKAKAEAEGLEVVVTTLKNMYSLFTSPDFAKADPGEQREILNSAEDQIVRIAPIIDSLASDDRQRVGPMAEKLLEMIKVLRRRASPLEADGTRTSISPKKSPSKQSTSTSTGTEPSWTSVRNEVLDSLKSLEEMSSSAEATAAPPEHRQAILGAIIEQIDKISNFAKSLPEEIRHDMVLRCKEVLSNAEKNLTGAQPKPATSNRSTPSTSPSKQKPATQRPVVEEDDEEEMDASPQVLEVEETLRSIAQLLSSEEFRGQPPAIRVEIAKKLHHRVHSLEEAISSLPTTPKVDELKENAHMLSNVLSAVMNHHPVGSAPAAAGDADEEDGGEGEVGNAADPVEERSEAVIKMLRQLFGIISGPQFAEADETRRHQIVVAVLQQLGPLERETGLLPEAHQNELMPLINSLRSTLNGFAAINVDGKGAGSKDKDVFERAADATADMENGKVTNMHQLKEMMELLEELDNTELTSDVQMGARRQFQQALTHVIDTIQRSGPASGEAEDDDGDEAEDEEEEGDEESNDGSRPFTINPALLQGLKEEEATFVESLYTLRSEMQRNDVTTAGELGPYMSALEAMIQEATVNDIDWREIPAAAALVSSLIEAFQAIQAGVTRTSTDETIATLEEANKKLEEAADGMTSLSQLAPWLSLLDSVRDMQDNLSMEELQAVQLLQRSVIQVSNRLSGETEDEEEEEGDEEDEIAEDHADGDTPTAHQNGNGSPARNGTTPRSQVSPAASPSGSTKSPSAQRSAQRGSMSPRSPTHEE